jgi:hypothetical protein
MNPEYRKEKHLKGESDKEMKAQAALTAEVKEEPPSITATAVQLEEDEPPLMTGEAGSRFLGATP